jgi:electron transfer flavoprotein alpha subunit
MSWEALAAGQELAAQINQPLLAAVAGDQIDALLPQLAQKKLARCYAVRHELLQRYTVEGFTAAFEQLITKLEPAFVLFPHTYQVRDFAPRLATRFEQALIADVVDFRVEAGKPVFVRQLLQGKLNADYTHSGAGPCFVSIQAGGFRADTLQTGACTVEAFTPQVHAPQIRSRPGDPFRAVAQTVNLSSADLIVSVGRGIKEKENIPVVAELAQALGAELAASSYLRQRMAPHGAPGEQFRPDRLAQAVPGCGHFRRDPAPGRHERLPIDHCH